MRLPLIHSNNSDLNIVQTKWKSVIDPAISNPLLSNGVLSGIVLSNGTTVIPHKLGRKLIGWMIVGINGAATIFDNQANNQTPNLTLSLTSDADVTVNILVF